VIDEALTGAVYPADADSMPTQPSHLRQPDQEPQA